MASGKWQVIKWMAFIFFFAVLVLRTDSFVMAQTASTPSREQAIFLHLSPPDLSDFPDVRLNLRTSDGQSAPLPNVDGLILQENGMTIREFELTAVPVGIDVIFVIDSNQFIQDIDPNTGLTHYAQVQASIIRFATRFMNPSGLDHVSIIVPAEQSNGAMRLLLDGATSSEEVVAAIESYSPPPNDATPLNKMMISALVQTQKFQTGNRFQTILLFSEGQQVAEQLDFDGLLAQAQAQQTAIFSAILGPSITVNEIDIANQLNQPTHGFYAHLPNAEDADPIYLLWQRQANQMQISYQSRLRENGRFPLTVTVGQATAAAEVNLNLQPPTVTIQPETSLIRRTAAELNTPLAQLTPTSQPVQIQLNWADNVSRELAEVTLFVNGLPQFLPQLPSLEPSGNFSLDWDIGNSDTGPYELVVEVTDSLGHTGISQPQLMTIVVERPSLPTRPPIVVTAPIATQPPPTPPTSSISKQDILVGSVATETAVLILLILLRRRRKRKTAVPLAPRPRLETEATLEASEPLPVAQLEPLPKGKPHLIQVANFTIGRDKENVQLWLDDPSIMPLHARIRRQNSLPPQKGVSRFWLYDEGGGISLNHQRLGLAPKMLQDGDLLQIGRYTFRFNVVSGQT